MDIKPLGSRVLIKRAEKKISKGGILLPETAQEKPQEGEVLAIGPGKKDDKGEIIPMQVSIGDKVLFSTYSGVDAPGEEDLLLIKEEDILVLIN